MIGIYENDDALISSVHFTTLSSILYVLIYVNRAVFAQCRFTVYLCTRHYSKFTKALLFLPICDLNS